MSVYLIAQILIRDRERYGSYESNFMSVFKQHKGKLLCVDEAPETLEGEWPYTRTVILEFPDKREADAWYHSDEYQDLAQHRFAASVANIVMVQGLAGDT